MMSLALPGDVWQLLCEELQDRNEFSVLFALAVTSKPLAAIALPSLYRMHIPSPGSEEEAETAVLQKKLVQKWSVYWRSLTLASIGETLYPYHSYLRTLDLRDLENLLSDDQFPGQIQRAFFAGFLSNHFHQVKVLNRNRYRLDILAIVESIGGAITKNTRLIEQVTGNFSANAFLSWVPSIPKLKQLELFSGDVLASEDVHRAIYKYCREFRHLSILQWPNADADRLLGRFIEGLPPQTLRMLITISSCGVSTETCLALGAHNRSAQELRLCLEADAIPSLSLLKDCSAIKALQLAIPETTDLETTQNDVLEDLTTWLLHCSQLREITLINFKAGPVILTPLLLSESTKLEDLCLDGRNMLYSVKDHRIFHDALARQRSLHTLYLKGDPEDVSHDVNEALVDALSKLTNLKKLQLRGVADYFSEDLVSRVLISLRSLEDVYIGGLEVTDTILPIIASLKNLKRITLTAISKFTLHGLLNFIEKLGEGNQGIWLSVDMADPGSLLSDDEIELIRESLQSSVGGKFDYVPVRDPNLLEFDDSDSE